MRCVSRTNLAIVAAIPAVTLAFIPDGRAEPQKSVWSGKDLTVSMRADALASSASARDEAVGLSRRGGVKPSGRQDLALKLAFDEDVRLVLPARQLLKIPDKEVMFVLEVGF